MHQNWGVHFAYGNLLSKVGEKGVGEKGEPGFNGLNGQPVSSLSLQHCIQKISLSMYQNISYQKFWYLNEWNQFSCIN